MHKSESRCDWDYFPAAYVYLCFSIVSDTMMVMSQSPGGDTCMLVITCAAPPQHCHCSPWSQLLSAHSSDQYCCHIRWYNHSSTLCDLVWSLLIGRSQPHTATSASLPAVSSVELLSTVCCEQESAWCWYNQRHLARNNKIFKIKVNSYFDRRSLPLKKKQKYIYFKPIKIQYGDV